MPRAGRGVRWACCVLGEARVCWELNTWIVEAALARLGGGRLSVDEQREIWNATRTPHKVRWPEWWSYSGE